MLKLKLQYFGHLMGKTDSLEKTLMLGKTEGGRRRGWAWDGWMASLTQWTWIWVNSRSWWWTGRPGVLHSMGLQRVRHDWVTELNWGRKLQGRRQDSNGGQTCIDSERGKSGWWAWKRLKKLKCNNVQKGRVAAVTMTWGKQQELARQKNMKKQSNSVKGKHWADGAIVPQTEDTQIMQQKLKKAKGSRNPGSFVASCASLLPFACVPEASAPMLAFPAAVLIGPQVCSQARTDGAPLALHLQRVPSVLPSPQVTPLPLGHSQRVRGLSFPSLFYSCGVHPKVLQLAL